MFKLKGGTSKFHLDQVSGVLTTSAKLDRDPATGGVEFYDITVKAADQGSPQKSTITVVRVGLINVNDNTPKFDQSFYTTFFSENKTSGKLIDYSTVHCIVKPKFIR